MHCQNYKLSTNVINKFLILLAENGNVTMSARMVGMSRNSIYKFAQRCPEFRQAMKEAHLEAKDLLVAETRRRAVQGVEETIYYKGQPCGTVTKYSDSLLALLLRGFYGIPHPVNTEYNLFEDSELNDLSDKEPQSDEEDYDLTQLSDDELDQFERLLEKIST